MPLFEYRCETCENRFEALVHGGQRPSCTKCGAKKLEKLISAFAVVSSSGSGSAFASGSGSAFASGDTSPGGCGSCGDPRGPGSCRTGED